MNNNDWRKRYNQAHYNWQMKNHKEFYEQSGCYNAKIPPVKTSNGLTKFVCNFLNWTDGSNATRVSSAGRYIEKKNHLGHKIANSGTFIPSTTRKGTADITATIFGKSVKFEVKVGNDRPSKEQILEQQRERAAGGIYEFISTPEDFLFIYDKIINNEI